MKSAHLAPYGTVYGIPGAHRVEEGDVISVDVGITLAGLVADSAYTFAVGEVDSETQRLLDVGKQALEAAMATPDDHSLSRR